MQRKALNTGGVNLSSLQHSAFDFFAKQIHVVYNTEKYIYYPGITEHKNSFIYVLFVGEVVFSFELACNWMHRDSSLN